MHQEILEITKEFQIEEIENKNEIRNVLNELGWIAYYHKNDICQLEGRRS
jgi:hypothetical protein